MRNRPNPMWPCVLLALALTAKGAPAATAPAPAGVAPGKGIRTLYLVRHGHYEPDSTADPRFGAGLDALGRAQARVVGRYLAKLPVHFTSLTSSTLTRARETADVMARELHMSVARDSLLSECTPRSLNPVMNRNALDSEIRECEAQLDAAWAKYVEPSPDADTHEVLVAHGNVIRWFVARAMANDSRQWGNMDIAHCSLTVLTVRPDGSVKLVLFSDLNDLPVSQQTWSGRGTGWTKPAVGMK